MIFRTIIVPLQERTSLNYLTLKSPKYASHSWNSIENGTPQWEKKGKKRGQIGQISSLPRLHSLRSPFFFTPTPISFSFFLQCGAWSQLHSEVKPAAKRRPHPIACHFLRGSPPSVERNGKTNHSTLPDLGSAIFRARLSSRKNIRKDLESWRLYNVFRTSKSVDRGTQREHC